MLMILIIGAEKLGLDLTFPPGFTYWNMGITGLP
jgi:hypothetical protein